MQQLQACLLYTSDAADDRISDRPYIDTQRISLVWLGLCSASEIGRLEASLIGSRELLKSEKTKWPSEIAENTGCLPAEIYKLVCSMNESLNENDGFRKQAVPTLVYKYFTEMKSMFINVRSMMKPSGLYGLVVGHNKTTLGGTEYNIDTPYPVSYTHLTLPTIA